MHAMKDYMARILDLANRFVAFRQKHEQLRSQAKQIFDQAVQEKDARQQDEIKKKIANM